MILLRESYHNRIATLYQPTESHMHADKPDNLLHEYLELKKMFELPLKIRLYLLTLENMISKNPQADSSRQKVVDPHLIRAFGSQN